MLHGFFVSLRFSSVQSLSSVSDSLRPHESQHARPPCPSPTPRVYPNSCQLSWWCHLTLCRPLLLPPSHARPPCPSPTPRVYPNSCQLSWWCHLILCRPLLLPPSTFPASGSFQISQFFESGSQSIGVSASTSVLPVNTEDWSPLGWTGWISLQSKWCSKVFSNTTVQKHQFFSAQLSLQSKSHIHTWMCMCMAGKNHSLD